MRSRELQIGDWVKSTDFPFQCSSIGAACVRVAYQSRIYNIKDNLLHPIPLTPEILVKNGFEKWSAQYRYRVLKPNTTIDKSVHFTLMKDGEHICEIRNYDGTHAEPRYYGVVRYIHELQRALRCCGLTDLADSLKV